MNASGVPKSPGGQAPTPTNNNLLAVKKITMNLGDFNQSEAAGNDPS
jgi:hypothetical protein